MPIALGLGSPSVFLRKALLAPAAAFLRETGCSLSVDLRFKVRLPAASIGAKCFSVVSLHANGREDSLLLRQAALTFYRKKADNVPFIIMLAEQFKSTLTQHVGINF